MVIIVALMSGIGPALITFGLTRWYYLTRTIPTERQYDNTHYDGSRDEFGESYNDQHKTIDHILTMQEIVDKHKEENN
jgi:hypothetical protein